MSAGNYLTKEGKEKLQRELDDLIKIKRPELAQKLKEAVAEGDLKENANYHDAKEKQALLESRIRDLEAILRSAVDIEEASPAGVVVIGSEVTVKEEGEDPETYKIVGAAEADPLKGFISNESPLGAGLLNKKKGAKVKVETPSGVITFTIVEIK